MLTQSLFLELRCLCTPRSCCLPGTLPKFDEKHKGYKLCKTRSTSSCTVCFDSFFFSQVHSLLLVQQSLLLGPHLNCLDPLLSWYFECCSSVCPLCLCHDLCLPFVWCLLLSHQCNHLHCWHSGE